jgi:transcriptional regulator with XRE-family HTH domain
MMVTMHLEKALAKKVLAFNLNKWLKKSGLNQREFAEQIGMMPQQLSFYATGKREPNPENLEKMANGLGLSNIWELYRMPNGFIAKDLQDAWNALIDLHLLTPERVAKVRDYIHLQIAAGKAEESLPNNQSEKDKSPV